MLKTLLPALLAVAAGVSFVIQQAMNANLRIALNSPAWAGFVNYFVGVACMAVLVMALRDPLPSTGPARRQRRRPIALFLRASTEPRAWVTLGRRRSRWHSDCSESLQKQQVF